MKFKITVEICFCIWAFRFVSANDFYLNSLDEPASRSNDKFALIIPLTGVIKFLLITYCVKVF